jgi:ABC-type multidrug transport system fused ATPase/permease subunit
MTEIRLYQGTIRFNVLLGIDREVSQEELDQACQDANVALSISKVDVRSLNSFNLSPLATTLSSAQKDPPYQEAKNNESR